MKNNYDKYIEEVWEMKDNAYNDFKKSGYKSYIEYIKNELKSIELPFSKKKSAIKTK